MIEELKEYILSSANTLYDKFMKYAETELTYEENKVIVDLFSDNYADDVNKLTGNVSIFRDAIKNKYYSTAIYAKLGFLSMERLVEPIIGITPCDDLVSFIIPNRGGKDIDKVIANINKVYKDYNHEIIVITQDDDKIFGRGQLRNIGVKYACGKYLAIVDNDIISLNDVDLVETYKTINHPFVLFTKISQVTYTDNETYNITSTCENMNGFGGFLFCDRDFFVEHNGYSNLCLGWGYEDNISCFCFNGIRRLDNAIGHITHPTRDNLNKKNTRINSAVFDSYATGYINHEFDGYNQITFSETSKKKEGNVLYVGVTNIGVCDDFKYNNVLDLHRNAILENAQKETVVFCKVNDVDCLDYFIDSLNAQTYKMWRCVLLFDDLDEDEINICLRKISGNKLFTYTGGFSDCNLKGLMCGAKYLVLTDSRHAFMNYYLNVAVEYLKNNKDMSVYYGNCIECTSNGTKVSGSNESRNCLIINPENIDFDITIDSYSDIINKTENKQFKNQGVISLYF